MSDASSHILERAITRGWTSFKLAWPLLLVASLAMIGAGIPGGVVSQIASVASSAIEASGGSPAAALAVTLVGTALSFVIGSAIQWPVAAGAAIAAVRAQRGHASDFGAILAGFRRFVPVVAAQALVSLLILGAGIPFLLSVQGPLWSFVKSGFRQIPDLSQLSLPLVFLCGALSTVLWFWLSARLSIAVIRAADPDLPRVGAAEAIRISIERTSGHTLIAVGMIILTSTVSILGFLLCCIGFLLVGMPLGLALNAGFYRSIMLEPDPTPTPHAPWPGASPPQTPV